MISDNALSPTTSTFQPLATAHPDDLVVTPQIPPRILALSGAVVAQVAAIESEMTNAPEVVDAATCTAVDGVRLRARELLKAIDTARVVAKAPAQALVTAIDGAARPYVRRLEAVVDEAKQQVEEHIRAERAKAQEADRKARAEAAVREEAERKAQATAREAGQVVVLRATAPLPVAAPIVVAPAVKTRAVRKVRVTDETQIPREFWTLNTVALNQAILREGRVVPGAEAYDDVVAS